MNAILLALILLGAVLVFGGFVRANEPDPPAAPASPPCDCVPRAWLVRSEARSRKRLHLARKYETQRNRLRAVLRASRRQSGTGVPWLDDALCVHSYESVNWFLDGHHDGGMQFNPGTWKRAGGYADARYAYQAQPIAQLYRAFVIWRQDGGSWREWSTAGLCGLR